MLPGQGTPQTISTALCRTTRQYTKLVCLHYAQPVWPQSVTAWP